MLEPLGVAMHAIEQAQIMIGDTVAVIGCGPIGLFAQQLARHSGATTLITCEISEARLKLARKQKAADVVIIDGLRVPTPLNSNSVIGHLVHTFSGRDVKHVIVDGKVVVREARLTQIEDKEVAEISAGEEESLWSRL